MTTASDVTEIVKDEAEKPSRDIRMKCLEFAVSTSLQKGDADGRSVLRRANAFLTFVLKGETPNE
jgi:hypothetical protein